MPTENRSSNTEMVSDLLPCPFCGEKPEITKHHREDIYGFMHRCQVLGTISWGFREDQDGHIEKWNARAEPAEPHQAEPVLWRYRKTPARSWFYTEHKRSAEIALLDGYIVEEFYTHADPGEVERLREALDECKDACVQHEAQVAEDFKHIDDLRAQLREQDALLHKVRKTAKGMREDSYDSDDTCEVVIQRIDLEELEAILSASSEPSAMAERIKSAVCPKCSSHPCACEERSAPAEIDHDALVAAVCVLRSHGLGNLSAAAEEARAALERKPS